MKNTELMDKAKVSKSTFYKIKMVKISLQMYYLEYIMYWNVIFQKL